MAIVRPPDGKLLYCLLAAALCSLCTALNSWRHEKVKAALVAKLEEEKKKLEAKIEALAAAAASDRQALQARVQELTEISESDRKGLQELLLPLQPLLPLAESIAALASELHRAKAKISFKTSSLLAAPGSLSKVAGDNRWGSTALSVDSIQVGPGLPLRGLRFRPQRSDRGFALGLVRSPARNFEFAVGCWKSGWLTVIQRGSFRLEEAVKYRSDVLVELRVCEGRMELWLEGQRALSCGSLSGPVTLHACANFRDVGAEAVEIEWLGPLPSSPQPRL